jgi:hypothetical protein
MPTNVTAANVIMGPCTSFQIDDQELGATEGGVSVEFKQTTQELTVDQIIDAVDIKPTKNEYTVKTTLSESTLKNLQLAWNQANPPTVDTQTQTTTLNVGLNLNLPEHTLKFVGPAPGGEQRTFTLHRVFQMSSGSVDIAKDKQQGIPVEFRCLPDLTQPAGSEYGTVVDAPAS